MCKRLQGDSDSFKNNADATLSGGGEAAVKVMGNTPICFMAPQYKFAKHCAFGVGSPF
jgi:hypothetical protein